MLKPIINALQMYDEKGVAVITDYEGTDCREIARDVISVLKRLKCDFIHYYSDVEHSYFIQDRMCE